MCLSDNTFHKWYTGLLLVHGMRHCQHTLVLLRLLEKDLFCSVFGLDFNLWLGDISIYEELYISFFDTVQCFTYNFHEKCMCMCIEMDMTV